MLKRIFCVLLVMFFMLGGGYSFAETEMAYEYGFYSIANKEVISQDDEKVVISFEITNNTDNYYPELFVLPTLKVSGDGKLKPLYSAYYNYKPTKFSLEPNESKYITLNCELPQKLPNKGAMISLQIYSTTHRVSVNNESFYLNEINSDFNGFIEGDVFSYWKMKDGTYVVSGNGPSVESSNIPQAILNLRSTFSEKKKIYPQYVVYERSTIYNEKPIYTGIGKEISFKPGEEKQVILDVPKFVKPESYLIKLNFVDESGTSVSYMYDYRYVVKGESAKVSKITIDNSSGENVIKGYIYGPADSSILENVTVEMFAYGEDGVLIAKSKENVKLSTENTITSLTLGNVNSSKILAEVKVNLNGSELAKKSENLKLDIQSNKDEQVFSDIVGTNCENAVKTLNGLGIINGYPDNTFKPENYVTRAEFSTIVSKLLELDIENEEVTLFSDINDHWAKSYINTIYNKGLVSGYPDGTFKPQNNVTYAETLTILLNALGYKAEINNKESEWPNNYIEKSVEIGLNELVEISDYMLPANRGDIALLTLKAYLLK